MDPAPPDAADPPPKRPGVATASLVLGILGFPLPLLASIPAILTGHLALNRIQRSNGALGGKGAAVAGLACGYLSLIMAMLVGLSASAGFLAAQRAIQQSKRTAAKHVCVAIDQAALAFHDEFGHLPGDPDGDRIVTLNGGEAARFLDDLGVNSAFGNAESARRILFIQLPEARAGRGGLVRDADGRAIGLHDPWGNPYRVVLDGDHDGVVRDPFGTGTLAGRRTLSYSYGRNGANDAGREDDIKSW
jgi:hypothetical protein